jgi:predicted ester cyclase
MDNKDVVRTVEEAWDSQDLDGLDQYFGSEFDNSASAVPGLPPGLAGAKMAHQGVMQSFPDRKVHIEEIVGDGDTVVVRTRVTGTNQGGFPAFNVPANDAPIDIAAVSIYRLRDGKVVGHWGLNDALTLMMQMGAIPAPE